MGRNSQVSSKLADKISKLPGRVHAAGLEEAVYSLPIFTYQDSGRAAFNWQTEGGLSTARVYQADRGKPPVGERGDGRTINSLSLDVVSLHRVKEIQQLLASVRAGTVKQSSITNPIDADYADNARLKAAMAEAKSKIEASMKKEVEAWHRE